jgi:anhydro-N-acetylmuramic acid kinase
MQIKNGLVARRQLPNQDGQLLYAKINLRIILRHRVHIRAAIGQLFLVAGIPFEKIKCCIDHNTSYPCTNITFSLKLMQVAINLDKSFLQNILSIFHRLGVPVTKPQHRTNISIVERLLRYPILTDACFYQFLLIYHFLLWYLTLLILEPLHPNVHFYLYYSMNPHLVQLYRMATQPRRRIIGLMSGTSLDGLDIALCRISGHGGSTSLVLEAFRTIPYQPGFKKAIQAVFSKQQVDLEQLTLLHPWVALQHGEMINQCLADWGIPAGDIDLIASHGQTIYHAPKSLHQKSGYGNATLQIGDGDHLAVATGIITISDFRQKNIAAGGEGAPLAGYGDQLLFGKPGEDRVLLNIGGIANFTYLPGQSDTEALFCSDTGPGNTIMDACMQMAYPGKYFDEDAAIARSGQINDALLAALKAHPFFEAPFPKTTGPELFNMAYVEKAKAQSQTTTLSIPDTMATLCRFSADTIITAMQQCFGSHKPLQVFCSGGGMHNPLLMEHLRTQLPHLNFATTDALQINPDAKEAVLFALLANECICSNAEETGKLSRGLPAVVMGKISWPK